MTELTYTLLSDGSSDTSLMPVLKWLLVANGVRCPIQGEWADLRKLHKPPARLPARIAKAVELLPCELLFVHRDAETEPYASRRIEIEGAYEKAFVLGAPRPVTVCVIPVRMQESWLLFNEQAIRRAAGNEAGRIPLDLPDIRKCESLADPKVLLYQLIRDASELGARRRARLRVGYLATRIASMIEDFSALRQLPAFALLEKDVQHAIGTNGWDRR